MTPGGRGGFTQPSETSQESGNSDLPGTQKLQSSRYFFFFNYCVSFSSWSRSLVLFIHCDWFSQMQQSRIL